MIPVDLKQQSDDKKITLSVSVKGDSFTEKEQREILQEFGLMSHLLYLKLATEIKDDRMH